MASDDETKDKVGMLNKREEFPGWKGRMLLLAMEKGESRSQYGKLFIIRLAS